MPFCESCGSQLASGAAFCSTCGARLAPPPNPQPPQANPPRHQPPSEKKSGGGWGLGCLGLIAFVIVLGGLGTLFHSYDAPSPDSTDAPATDPSTPKPDLHAQRQVIHDWWGHPVVHLAAADEFLQLAAQSVANGDLTTASTGLEKGADQANTAHDEAVNAPDGWKDEGVQLQLGAADLSDALSKERTFLDSQKPSDGADATAAAQRALNEINDATHRVRVRYVALGGKWSDIDDMQKVAQTMQDILQATSR